MKYIKRKGIGNIQKKIIVKECLQPNDLGKKAAELQAEMILDDYVPINDKKTKWRYEVM